VGRQAAHDPAALHDPAASGDPRRRLAVRAVAPLRRRADRAHDGRLARRRTRQRLACNALPTILAANHCSHQYFQLANQIECTPGNRAFSVPHGTDLLFGLATGDGRCAANLHMGWPRLAGHLWLAAPGELCAPLFAPCRLTTAIDGVPVRIDEATTYPFSDDVAFTIRTPAPVTFTLTLRIPAWCEQPAVERGPLVFALPIGEDWRPVAGTPPFADFEVHPTTPWNYALAIDPAAPQRSIHVESRPAAAQPWSPAGSPLVLHTGARRVPQRVARDGVAGPLPEGAFATAPADEAVQLIPFGAARLRIGVLPVVPRRAGPAAARASPPSSTMATRRGPSTPCARGVTGRPTRWPWPTRR